MLRIPQRKKSIKFFYDPQTSGGLLGAVPRGNSGKCLQQLTDEGYSAAIIGQTQANVGNRRKIYFKVD